MCSPNNFCPVPFDQQPMNEFYELKNSCFFSFFGFHLTHYFYGLVIISCVSVSISIPLITFTHVKTLIHFLLAESLFITITIILVVTRLYLGWSYVINRLFSATIFYEESGWHDGQIWVKTPDMLTRDRLVATYYIKPILSRVKYTVLFLAFAIVLESFLYSLLC